MGFIRVVAMARIIFQETRKRFITCDDKEIDVLDRLNAYFRDHPSQNLSFIESCHTAMCRWGRISRAQYDTLRSIWNNLELENVDENRESV